MASDWIKMRKELAQDVAVIVMCDKLGLDEFGVVGRLHAVWAWADGQIAAGDDGNAHGVTKAFLDRYVGAPGFADAMVAAGWLEVTADGLRFPNFERHNTQTAKTRGLTAIRAAACKAKGNAEVTPKALPNAHPPYLTEEKRREEKPFLPASNENTSSPEPLATNGKGSQGFDRGGRQAGAKTIAEWMDASHIDGPYRDHAMRVDGLTVDSLNHHLSKVKPGTVGNMAACAVYRACKALGDPPPKGVGSLVAVINKIRSGKKV